MSKAVRIKDMLIGGGNRIAVQSMTNTDTLDTAATAAQLRALAAAGCDIARIAVSSDAEVEACKPLIGMFGMPLVADIQFDCKLAVRCCEIGFDKIRFNPGNIGDETRVKYLVDACKAHGTPIRVGVNTGSLEKELLGEPPSTALVKSAMKHVRLLEKFGFYDNVISVKSSDVKTTVEAYRKLASECDYPLHVGVTESGTDERARYRAEFLAAVYHKKVYFGNEKHDDGDGGRDNGRIEQDLFRADVVRVVRYKIDAERPCEHGEHEVEYHDVKHGDGVAVGEHLDERNAQETAV